MKQSDFSLMSIPKFQRIVCTGLGIGLIALVGTVRADDVARHYHIPQQSLDKSLLRLAADSGLEILFTADKVRGVSGNGLDGIMTSAQALTRLLQGSGMTYRFVDAKTVTVERSDARYRKTANVEEKPEPQSSSYTTLPNVTVIADANAGTRSGITVYKNDSRFDKSYAARFSSSSTKTDTPIKATPQSIQVIKRSLMNDQQNIFVSESLRNVSGVVTNSSILTPAFDTTRIRGFPAEQLVDGFTQYYNPGDRESSVNIDRIEVLKGTNGILYGGGSGSTVGGVVNITSKLPQVDPFGEFGFKIGTNDWYQPYLDVNRPINDNVLFRFTGEYTNAGSYLDVVKTERFNLNPTFTFTDNEKTTLTLQAKVSRWEQPEYQGLPATGTIAGNFKIPKNTFIGSGDIPDSKSEFNGVWGTLDHKFNDVWSINVRARYASSEFTEKVQTLFGKDGFTGDVPRQGATWSLANVELFQEQEERSFIGNAIAKFDLGPSKNTLLIGADHSQYDDKGYMETDFGFSGNTINFSNPALSSIKPFVKPGKGINDLLSQNTTYGGYTQLQSTLFDRFHFLGGVRIGHIGLDYTSASPLFGDANMSTGKTKVLPRVGAVFDLTKEASLFINYNEGMRGQPFVNFVSAPSPEESTTLEGGIKFDVAKQLTGQIAGYQIDRSKVAVTDNTDALFRAIPLGQQRSVGIETDLMWEPLEELSVLVNFAYTDAKFTDNLAGVPKGNKLPLAPEYSGRLWVNYRFLQPMLKGLSIGGGLYAQSEAYLSNNNNFKAPGFHTFDASISYEYERFKLAATIKNLTDNDYFQPYSYFGGRVIPVDGTSAFVTGSVKF